MPSWMVEFKLPPDPNAREPVCLNCGKRATRWISCPSQRFSAARCFPCAVGLLRWFASKGVTDVKEEFIGRGAAGEVQTAASEGAAQ